MRSGVATTSCDHHGATVANQAARLVAFRDTPKTLPPLRSLGGAARRKVRTSQPPITRARGLPGYESPSAVQRATGWRIDISGQASHFAMASTNEAMAMDSPYNEPELA